MESDTENLIRLATLAMPVATVAWTVTHEEIFREPREWCQRQSQDCNQLLKRKFFYLFTCEYCFSHYIAALFTWSMDFRLLVPGWRGSLIGWLALLWIANIYMSAYGRLRVDLRVERAEAEARERRLQTDKGEQPKRERRGMSRERPTGP